MGHPAGYGSLRLRRQTGAHRQRTHTCIHANLATPSGLAVSLVLIPRLQPDETEHKPFLDTSNVDAVIAASLAPTYSVWSSECAQEDPRSLSSYVTRYTLDHHSKLLQNT